MIRLFQLYRCLIDLASLYVVFIVTLTVLIPESCSSYSHQIRKSLPDFASIATPIVEPSLIVIFFVQLLILW